MVAITSVTNIDWNLFFSVATQLISLAFVAGIGWTKLRILEKDFLRLETEVVEYRAMREDLAVVKTQLQNIQLCLNRLANKMEKEQEKHDA